jgi:hypothetical protein
MIQLTRLLEEHKPDSALLFPLYRLVIGAHMYKGYRQGLRQLVEEEA